MPYDSVTGVFTRPSNSFSEPVFGTIIDPSDAIDLFDAYDAALSDIANSSVETVGFYTENNSTDHAFTMKARRNVALAYAVPVFRTLKENSPTAMDLWPSGPVPVEAAGGNGFTWFDACDADLSVNELTPIRCARMAMTSTAARFGMVNFNGATETPIEFIIGSGGGASTIKASINTSGVFKVGPGTDSPVFGSLIQANDAGTTSISVRDSTNHSEFFAAASTAVFLGSATNHAVTLRVNNINQVTFNTSNNVDGIATLTRAAGVAVQGTNTNDSAAASYVGEYITANQPVGSAAALTTGNPLNVLVAASSSNGLDHIQLTAGDWDVTAQVYLLLAATTNYTNFQYSFNTTSATMSVNPGQWITTQTAAAGIVTGVANITFGSLTMRVSLASTTSIYLVAQAAFTVAGASVWGAISARRVR